MPNTNRAPELPAPPSNADILECHRRGITYVDLLAERAGSGPRLEPDDGTEDRLEKLEQLQCRKVFRAFGGRVYSLSQARASKQTPGLGDDFVFLPKAGVALWFECKRQKGGKQSTAQREFQELCAQCGIRYVIGGVREAWALLRELGLADENNEPVRRP